MKPNFVFLFLAFLLAQLPCTPAQATFPGKEVAYWDISVSPDKNDPEYNKVHELVGKKNYDEAMKILDQKIQENPKAATPRLLKGLVLNEKGDYQKALKTFRAGYQLQIRHPVIHFGFCQIYRNLGKAEMSERACIIAVNQHFNRPEAYYEFAQTLMATGRMREANKNLEKAVQLDPHNARYPFDRGMNFLYLAQYDEAEQAFRRTLEIQQDHLDAMYQLGYLFAAQGKADLSRSFLHKLLETKKDHPIVRSGKILLQYVDNDELDKIPLDIKPHEYHAGRSKSLFKKRKYGLSLIEIQTAARLRPDDLKIQEILVGMASLLMRLDLAEKAVNHYIEIAGNDSLVKAKGYQELADIRVLQGKLDEARNYYEKAQTLGDPNQLAKTSLAQFPKDLKMAPPQVFQNETFIQPTEALNRKGEVFAHYGMYERAIAIYSIVLRMNPKHLESLLNSAAAYYKSGQEERTISILERLLTSHPHHEHILAHRLLLAQAYIKQGDLADGLKNLERAIKLDPSVKSVIKTDPVFEKLRDSEDYQRLVR